jgi:leader peptidase (prepilin peptidase)/N-methyltransferase
MQLLEILAGQPLLLGLAGSLLGLLIGSFLNVVILRLPVMLERQWRAQCAEPGDSDTVAEEPAFNLVTPGSRCPNCGTEIGAFENIPVISYVLQRGRCRHCGTGISVQYPLVELSTGVLSAIVLLHFGPTLAGGLALVFTWALIALTVIDLREQLLPDVITLPWLWLGIGIALLPVFADLQSSVIGAMAGYLSLWLIFHLFRLLTGKEGMGYGDFKLLAMLGAWLGWQSLPAIILVSSVVGAMVGIALILARRQERGVPIPFGPFLAAAGWINLLWGDRLTRLYLEFSGLA